MMTGQDHLAVLRRMLMRCVGVVLALSIGVFCFKAETFRILLAPSRPGFVTFRLLEKAARMVGIDIHITMPKIDLISTELSAQFMTHVTTSLMLGALLASPYILVELLRFVSPALYANERKYSGVVALTVYALFFMGVALTYYVLFPLSFRFLAGYQVDPSIANTITLDSYVSTFTTLTFMMGMVALLPVISWILGKMGILDAQMLRSVRPYAFVGILVIAAIITPPDLFTLLLVSLPLYLLYELSILTLPNPIESK